MKAPSHVVTAIAVVGFMGSAPAFAGGIPTDGTIADTAERVVDSVVNISVSTTRGASDDEWFGMGGAGGGHSSAKGSGVIVTAGGRILTNAHVIDGFDDIRVTLQDGTELDAKVVGKDTKVDLAVIQLQGRVPSVKPIAFGDSSTLRLGDIVLAVGDGMGVGKSVSMGIVSAKGRAGMGLEEYEDFIQTDAAINPGNSGGALVNLKGELVGVNTAIASKSGGSQGIGFAIPSNMARPIMEMLVRDGKVTRGYLGVDIVTVTPALAKQYKLGASTGVVVGGVQAGGPAAKAKLVQGDVIVAIDGAAMKNDGALRNTIAMMRPGTTTSLKVVHRDGSAADVKVKLGEKPDERPVADQQPGGGGVCPKVGPGWKCQQTQNGCQCWSEGRP
jgi:S1-C subfamily serine protease